MKFLLGAVIGLMSGVIGLVAGVNVAENHKDMPAWKFRMVVWILCASFAILGALIAATL